MSELNELLEETETTIKDYSEELVQQLALRDELEFEKEVKNSFISVLIEVQNKQKEHKEAAKKKKKLNNGSSQNGKTERSHIPGTVSGALQGALQPGTGSAVLLAPNPAPCLAGRTPGVVLSSLQHRADPVQEYPVLSCFIIVFS